jgi:hypothetical protein
VQNSRHESKALLALKQGKKNNNKEPFVDNRQHRVSGQAALRSGHRLKLVLILTLAVFAAGYFVLELANQSPGDLVEKLSGADCDQHYYSDADAASVCTAVAASTDIPQVFDAAEIASSNTKANNSRQDTRASNILANTRTRDDAQADYYGPRPGYTMAELCSSGLGNTGQRCQTGSYDRKFIASGAGAMRGSTSGYTISGQVLTAEGIGLGGVSIVASPERLKAEQIIPDAGKLRFRTQTDSLGAYSLDGLPDGEYTIRSSTHGSYQSARISVRAGVNYADLVVSRNSTTVVEGQVFSVTGEPLEGVTVLPNLLGQPSVLTDYDGRFRLTVALKPTISSFALRFQRPGYHEQSGKVEFPHHGSTNGVAANVVMHPVESWTSVNGKVYSDSGEPLAGRKVELRPQSAQRTYSTITDQQGQYTFPVVESPADYRLIVFGGTDHKDHQEAVKLTADMADLDIVVESYEFGKITGQLVNLNGEPVPNFDLVLRNTGSRKPNTLVTSDTFGNFEIPSAPAGELVVASQSTPSILAQGLYLNPGDKLHVPLVLDWGEHEIHGIVVDTQGNPVPASRIVLQWSHQADGITTKATRRTASDSQGYFAFSNLGPGPHSLRIDAPGFSTVGIDHDLSRQGYDLTVRLN